MSAPGPFIDTLTHIYEHAKLLHKYVDVLERKVTDSLSNIEHLDKIDRESVKRALKPMTEHQQKYQKKTRKLMEIQADREYFNGRFYEDEDTGRHTQTLDWAQTTFREVLDMYLEWDARLRKRFARYIAEFEGGESFLDSEDAIHRMMDESPVIDIYDVLGQLECCLRSEIRKCVGN